MISKGMLKFDIIGQSLIIGGMLLYGIFTPRAFVIIGLLTFFFLGFWQFCNGLIQAVAFRSKIRIKYILTAIAYLIGLVILTVINDSFTRKMSHGLMEFFVGVYFIGGCLALAIWYYYQTYSALLNNEFQHPRSFWDYEF